MDAKRREMAAALELLAAAHDEAGLPVPRSPSDAETRLTEIAAAIYPLTLPPEVDYFWRHVDVDSIVAQPFPRITDPAGALAAWSLHTSESPGMVPRLLFPVCNEGWDYVFVELDDGSGVGGACLEWGYGGSPFSVRFGSLTDYVDLWAGMIERREFEQRHTDGQSWFVFDPHEHWPTEQATRLASTQPLPRLGMAVDLDEDIRAWPEHWLTSDALAADTRDSLGADTTIAALLELAVTGEEARGTIHATVSGLAGTAGGMRATVEDGTGALDLWCPSEVTRYGPRIRERFEFDVVLSTHPVGPSDVSTLQLEVSRHAQAGDIGAAQGAASRLHETLFGTPADAHATAVRPLE